MREHLARWGPPALITLLLAVVVIGLGTTRAAPTGREEALGQRLRCPICKSVSIAESPSETASQMRRIVAEQVDAGRSDQEIISYFQARYGKWVLLDPPAAGQTLWLWVLVAAAVAVGGAVVALRGLGADPPVPSLAEADREAVSAAVEDYRLTSEQDDEL